MARSIFALELCFRNLPGSPLRGALHQAVVSHPERASREERHHLYRHIAELLVSNLQLAERGCWDYFDDHDRAVNDFKMWCDGMMTEEGVRPGPSGPLDPYRPEPRYMTFTLAMLFVQGSPTDVAMKRFCEVPEQALWHKSTFARILRGMNFVSFASVESDVVYLIPGDDTWSLTLDDLAQPKFEYLRPLVNA